MKYYIYLTIFLSLSLNIQARDKIKGAGSMTLYPLINAVGEVYNSTTGNTLPMIAATGTDKGFKLFCAGNGENYLDFISATRKIKTSEKKLCSKNGVTRIVEIPIGYDAIVLASSRNSVKYKLKLAHLFLALVAKVPLEGKIVDNYYKKWSDISRFLPDTEIKIFGPGNISGLRNSFIDLVMRKTCTEFSEYKKLYANHKKRDKICTSLRKDGHYIIEKNQKKITNKILANNNSLAILDFSALEKNLIQIKGAYISGEYPDFDSIFDMDYPLTRTSYIYIKQDHFNIIPNLAIFIKMLISEDAIGEEGYLLFKGLVPLNKKARKQMRSTILKILE